MTFEIIKLKQDMLVISKRIHIDKFEDQLNQQFASFIQSTPLTAPLKQQVIDIQNAVLVQFKNNNRLINEAQNRPVNAARLVDAYEFSAIKPLETLQSQITHFPKKTQDKIAQLIKKIKSLEKDCIKFNQAQKNLNEAMAALRALSSTGRNHQSFKRHAREHVHSPWKTHYAEVFAKLYR
jgi:hypothetical protein